MTSLQSLMNLQDQTAIITGAAGKLGVVICSTLAEQGANLILVDREVANLERLASELSNRWSVVILYFGCDLDCEEERDELIHQVKGGHQNLTILINNAAFIGDSALQGWTTPFEQQSLDSWRRAIEVNLTAAFHLCQAFTPELAASEVGSIINIASIYGEFGPDWRLYSGVQMGNPAAYGVSKGGLIQLTRWLATTLAPNIRVNAISPGGILRSQPPSFTEKYSNRTPLGRMATEDDFRGAIAYLASNLSSYVTGQVLRVDGGWGEW